MKYEKEVETYIHALIGNGWTPKEATRIAVNYFDNQN